MTPAVKLFLVKMYFNRRSLKVTFYVKEEKKRKKTITFHKAHRLDKESYLILIYKLTIENSKFYVSVPV